jgi:hypothetical protein
MDADMPGLRSSMVMDESVLNGVTVMFVGLRRFDLLFELFRSIEIMKYVFTIYLCNMLDVNTVLYKSS